jgi:hemolysin III
MVTDHIETPAEEFLNSLTHGLGFVLSLVGLAALMVTYWNRPVSFLATATFGVCLVTMYLMSTLYHGVRHEALKTRLHRLDHVSIHLVIAGTYTPYLLLALPETGYRVLALVWFAAVAGSLFVLCGGVRYYRVTLISYLLMGWFAVFLFQPLSQALTLGGLLWLISGGLAYTLGSVFYATHYFRYSHAVWHVFVIAASFCHFMSVWLTAQSSLI